MRDRGLDISVNEWLTLMEALEKNLHSSSLYGFYNICRCSCIKNESKFDLFDQCFAEYFKDVVQDREMIDQFSKWLEKQKKPFELTDEMIKKFKQYDMDEIRKMFEERLKQQEKRHDGGNKWVGTGGTSPFGNSGYHPGGIRVHGEGMSRSAAQIASKRRFRNLRNDLSIDTRQISAALKQLRKWSKHDRKDILDIDESIAKTAKNAGEIEIEFMAEKKNKIKLLLLMDVGGSMTPYSQTCSLLFSAAHSAKHFKDFKYFYFHNCPYQHLYSNIELEKTINTEKVLKKYDKDWTVMIVGDAAMHPYELLAEGGAIDYFYNNSLPGIDWLKKIKRNNPSSVWLNPEPKSYWEIHSCHMIRQVFPMFNLTIKGISEAIDELRTGRAAEFKVADEIKWN